MEDGATISSFSKSVFSNKNVTVCFIITFHHNIDQTTLPHSSCLMPRHAVTYLPSLVVYRNPNTAPAMSVATLTTWLVFQFGGSSTPRRSNAEFFTCVKEFSHSHLNQTRSNFKVFQTNLWWKYRIKPWSYVCNKDRQKRWSWKSLNLIVTIEFEG